MGLFRFFKKQLATVVEWQPQEADRLFWKFPAVTDEIKNASKLIVAPGQGCILVYEGKVVNVIDSEGVYNLSTSNHPFITSLLKFAQLFESEHKMGLYFYRKAQVLNQGWGTSAPIKYIDEEYNIPVQLSAYGNFSYRLLEAEKFFIEYVGAQDEYTTMEFREVAQSRIPQIFASYLAKEKIPYLKIDQQVNELAKGVGLELATEFDNFGLELLDFRIEGNSFDKDTQERIGRIADVSADTQAASEGGLTYAQLEKLRALRDSAQNEGGVAGVGVALGAGVSMGKMFSDQVDEVTQPVKGKDPVEQLRKLKLLFDEEILTKEEYEEKKKAYLNDL
ncbi:SPFH domain-containing protein [Sphingobacterium sp. UT-1RO-CII-1]|uniref:SPFH domain-containing protein n=1 Tax=Sphingobacterium sp. UT-1RO-CII-1 TaxID=2995225 RepID=UPI00227A1E79|nr:SPFH domain-containing protein [Sphingobacterium sp. UT-1RO-CII-1]MCY4779314.1 SPFH domain-containing protein [Sphingobacterium sp. UT-1RO-CII-1]